MIKQAIKAAFGGYVDLTQEQIEKLAEYYAFLTEYNKKVNLTAVTDCQGVAIKHFLDSALGARFVPQGALLCDVGSGAGFPSVVIKLIRNDVNVTMVESVGKKTEFLRQLLAKLDLSATVVNARAEDLAKTQRESFDCVTARAVASLPVLMEYCAPLVKVGGVFLAYKGVDGQNEEKTAENAAKVLGLNKQTFAEFVLPDGGVRNILIYSKIAFTPPKYPRGQNKCRKNPIL